MQIGFFGWRTEGLWVSDMDLLNKLTIKNLKLNKKRTIVTIIGIMLSVALVMAVAAMFFSAHASLVAFEVEEKGNYHYQFQNVPAEKVKEFQQNRKIENLYVTSAMGYAEYEGIQNENKPYLFVQAFDEGALENLAVNLLEGRLPENDKEVLIPAHLESNGGVVLEVGNKIILDVGKRVSEGYELDQNNPYNEEVEEEIVDTEPMEYTIVGIMERFPYEIESYSGPGYTLITRLNEENTTENVDVYVRYKKKVLKDHLAITAGILEVDEAAFIAVNSYSIFEQMSEEEQSETLEEVNQAQYQWSQNGYLISLETGLIGDFAMKALANAVVVVIVIIIVTSVFCIKNSFDISITEKIRQYGMLSSIGATRRQIRRNVYYEAGILGAMGIPLGVFAGLFAAYVLVHVSNYFLGESMNVKLIFAFSWPPVLFSVLLGGVTILLSARKSARKASRISPIQAIRSSNEIQLKSSKIRSPWIIRKLFGIGGEISYKNLKRSRRKYRTTVISIIICVAVFIACTSFVNMAFDVIKTEYKNTDYNLAISYPQKEMKDDVIAELRELEGVEKFSRLINSYLTMDVSSIPFSEKYLELYEDVETDDDYLEVYVLDEKSFRDYVEELNLDYEDARGKGILYNTCHEYVYDENDNGTEVQYYKYTYKTGDTISGIAPDHEAEPIDIEIGAVTEKLPLGVYHYSSNALLILGEEYDPVFENELSDVNLYFYAENATKVQKEAEKLLDNVSLNIYNGEDNVRMMESMYTLIAIFLYGFIIVIALIGVTNIFNTITTNMNLRRREFAMLKSVGMTPKEFHRMIQLESFFYGTKSLLIGIPLGIGLSYVLHSILMSGDLELMYVVPVNAILIAAAAVFLLIAVIMRYSIRKIEQQNIIETIRNENI